MVEVIQIIFRRNASKDSEPPHVKTNKVACAPTEDSVQPGHPPSLIRVFAVRFMGSKGPKVSSCDSEDSDQTGRIARLI